jgi:hypothetical protein
VTDRAMLKIYGILVIAIVLNSCVLSVDPVIPESGATFDPRLLGTWEEVSGSDRAVVSRATENTYAIEYGSDGKVGRFEARLGRLDERLVLDVSPAPRDGDLPQPYAGVLFAGHVLFSLDVGPDEIRVAALEPDSLLAALRAGEVRLAHGGSGDQIVLHGTTEQLRSALGPYALLPPPPRRPVRLNSPASKRWPGARLISSFTATRIG